VILLDLDDYDASERSDDDFQRLVQLREEIPSLKVTLFTIPANTNKLFWLVNSLHRNWIDLVQHGWHHKTNYECLAWTKADCKAALRRGRDMGFTTKGFKAPGWQISDGCYEALAEEGYWVADQKYNDARRPRELRAYILGKHVVAKRTSELMFIEPTLSEPGNGSYLPVTALHMAMATQIHGHVGHLGGHNANALELIMDDIRAAAAKDTDFRFIREVMET
jgi:hypothetical protein